MNDNPHFAFTSLAEVATRLEWLAMTADSGSVADIYDRIADDTEIEAMTRGAIGLASARSLDLMPPECRDAAIDLAAAVAIDIAARVILRLRQAK